MQGWNRNALLVSSAIVSLAAATSAAAQTKSFDVPAQSVQSAVTQLGRQADIQIIAARSVTRGARSTLVRGNMTAEQALSMMLQGTGLTFRQTGPQTYTVIAAPRSSEAQASGQTASSSGEEPGLGDGDIVVTGSRIRGAKGASPFVSIDREEMKRAGHHTLGEAIRALPQSFAGGQNPGVGIGASTAGGSENQNNTGGSSLNLRGLGPGATLTLLNGARLPYDGVFQATDIGAIPAAAIERIEILLDGASAIYGSDAVGGVANVILRRDYDGLEASARYGFATEGGNEQQQYTALGGATWASGGFMLTGDYSFNTAVRARDRPYLATMTNQNVTIFPRIEQWSALFSGHQALGENLEFSLDSFYSRRKQQLLLQSGPINDDRRTADAWGFSPALSLDLANDWTTRLSGFIGSNEATNLSQMFNATTGALQSTDSACLCNTARSVTLEAEGPLFTLPGGSARVAFGVGYRYNRLDFRRILGQAISIDRSRESQFVFGEVSLPFVGPAAGIPLVSRFSLNGAIRYEDYSDYSGVATPKVGVVWSLVEGFDLKASWGKSFKMPNLQEQYLRGSASILPASVFAGLSAPPGGTVLFLSGGNPDLGPERATVFTAGVAVTPSAIRGLRIEFGWFDIDYRERIAAPLGTQAAAIFTNPAHANFIIFNPTVAQQQQAFALARVPYGQATNGVVHNPATVVAITNNINFNVAAQRTQGIDASVLYATSFADGTLSLSLNGTWLDGARRLIPLAPEILTTGRAYFPADFKGRAGVSWSGGGFSASTFVNHVAGVRNTLQPGTPFTDGFTTIDLTLGYSAESGPLGALEVNLQATNLLNQEPPIIRTSSPLVQPFDATNYSGIGRFLSFGMTKRF